METIMALLPEFGSSITSLVTTDDDGGDIDIDGMFVTL